MRKQLLVMTIGAAICLCAAQTANAAFATFENISSAVGLFQVDSISGNMLSLDVTLFEAHATSSMPIDNKFDTIYFDVVAPAGYYIKSISYNEALKTTIKTNGGYGATIATGSAVVEGTPLSFGTHIYSSNTSNAFALGITDYSIPGQLSTVDVSITNQITAIAFAGADAFIQKGPAAATIEVEVAPVPVPATLWLLGSAVAGLVITRRNRQDA